MKEPKASFPHYLKKTNKSEGLECGYLVTHFKSMFYTKHIDNQSTINSFKIDKQIEVTLHFLTYFVESNVSVSIINNEQTKQIKKFGRFNRSRSAR